MASVLKLSKLALVSCGFRAQSCDCLNFVVVVVSWFSIHLLGRFLLMASTSGVEFNRH